MSPAAFLFTGAFCWNLALAVSQVIIPLYAYQQGYSGVSIGGLVSLPFLVQMFLRFVAGALADRFGEKRVLIWTYAMMTLAGLIFFRADSFGPLLTGQFVVMLSRASYWTSAQSLTTRLPGGPGKQLGRLAASNHAGAISGNMAAGVLYAGFGFGTAILSLAAAGLIALIATLRLPGDQRRARRAAGTLFQNLWPLFRLRPLYFAILCSFVAAFPSSMVQSFYPVWLAQIGLSSAAIGPLVALRPIGSMVGGLLLARFLHESRHRLMMVAAVLAVAVAVGLTPLPRHISLLAVVLMTLGVGSVVADLIYQLIATGAGGQSSRASAMALGGVGFNLSHFVTPLVTGLLADTLGLAAGFYAWGLLMLAVALAVVPMYRWAQRNAPAPAGEAPPTRTGS